VRRQSSRALPAVGGPISEARWPPRTRCRRADDRGVIGYPDAVCHQPLKYAECHQVIAAQQRRWAFAAWTRGNLVRFVAAGRHGQTIGREDGQTEHGAVVPVLDLAILNGPPTKPTRWCPLRTRCSAPIRPPATSSTATAHWFARAATRSTSTTEIPRSLSVSMRVRSRSETGVSEYTLHPLLLQQPVRHRASGQLGPAAPQVDPPYLLDRPRR